LALLCWFLVHDSPYSSIRANFIWRNKILLEQTDIAKKLGISMNALHRILRASGYEPNYKLLANKRHYEYEAILDIIRNARGEQDATRSYAKQKDIL